MNISIIVAMAHNRIIGKDNQMPWHLPADLAWFKKSTLGKPILMGRKTFESIGRPLPGRTNIVLTRDKNYSHDGIVCVSSLAEGIQVAEEVFIRQETPEQDAELMIIGGGSIYQRCLPLVDKLYLTHIDLETDGDTQFPEYGTNWTEIFSESHQPDEKNPYAYRYSILEK